MSLIINVLIVATAENRVAKHLDEADDDMPHLLDKFGNACNDNQSDLDKQKYLFLQIISDLYPIGVTIKYITIDPSFYSDRLVTENDDRNYMGHLDMSLNQINIGKYKDFFDCIFIASAYYNMFDYDNILVMSTILKKRGNLITTHPTGMSALESSGNYAHVSEINTQFNRFKKIV